MGHVISPREYKHTNLENITLAAVDETRLITGDSQVIYLALVCSVPDSTGRETLRQPLHKNSLGKVAEKLSEHGLYFYTIASEPVQIRKSKGSQGEKGRSSQGDVGAPSYQEVWINCALTLIERAREELVDPPKVLYVDGIPLRPVGRTRLDNQPFIAVYATKSNDRYPPTLDPVGRGLLMIADHMVKRFAREQNGLEVVVDAR